MYTRMSFRTQRRSKHNKVFGDTSVEDDHRAHGSSCVVEHPFGGVVVDADLGGGVGGGEVLDDVVYHEGGVVWGGGGGYSCLGEFVDFFGVEDVPSVLVMR